MIIDNMQHFCYYNLQEVINLTNEEKNKLRIIFTKWVRKKEEELFHPLDYSAELFIAFADKHNLLYEPNIMKLIKDNFGGEEQ